MDIAGYNKERVEEIGQVIIRTYATIADQLGVKIEQQLVVPMSTLWYAPEAVDEFNDIAKAVKKMGKNMEEAYQAYRDWIQKMGETWAENTKGKKPHLANPHEIGIKVNVSAIQKENGGNVTLDEAGAIAVAGKMADLHAEMLSLVKSEHAKLEAASAFIGHGQAAAATACFIKVADALSQLFQLMETIGERLKQYAKKYQEVGEGIASQLNSAQISIK